MEKVECPGRHGIVREVLAHQVEHLVHGCDPEHRGERADVLGVVRRSACHDLHGKEVFSRGHHDAKVASVEHDPPSGRSRRHVDAGLVVEPVPREVEPPCDRPGSLSNRRVGLPDTVEVTRRRTLAVGEKHRCPTDQVDVRADPPTLQFLVQRFKGALDGVAVEEGGAHARITSASSIMMPRVRNGAGQVARA